MRLMVLISSLDSPMCARFRSMIVILSLSRHRSNSLAYTLLSLLPLPRYVDPVLPLPLWLSLFFVWLIRDAGRDGGSKDLLLRRFLEMSSDCNAS